MDLLTELLYELIRREVLEISSVQNMVMSLFGSCAGLVIFCVLHQLRKSTRTPHSYYHLTFPWSDFLACFAVCIFIAPIVAGFVDALYPMPNSLWFAAIPLLLSANLYKIPNLTIEQAAKFIANVWISIARRDKLKDEEIYIGGHKVITKHNEQCEACTKRDVCKHVDEPEKDVEDELEVKGDVGETKQRL